MRSSLGSRWQGWGAFSLLLAVALPLTVSRAHLESNLWIDESYSLLLTAFPLDRLVAVTAEDSHPPGYYLLLTAWLKVGRIPGGEPGIFWARWLNLLAWVVTAALVWHCGGRRWGFGPAAVVTALLLTGAAPAVMARDLRSYAIASGALLLAFLTRRSRRIFGGYLAAGLVALWMHALALPALGILALWTAVEVYREGGDRGVQFRHWLWRHGLLALGYLPWLPYLWNQFRYVTGSDPQWMTAPTVVNLFRVFTFWIPLGRIGSPAAPTNAFLVPLGVAAVAVPVAVGFWGLLRTRSGAKEEVEDPRRRDAGAALGIAVLFVAVLWGLDRWGWAHTFHGPRYPFLIAPLFLTGVGLMAVETVRRRAWSRWVIALLLAPWLVASGVGQIKIAREEARWGIEGVRVELQPFLPAKGAPVLLLPAGFAPYYRSTFEEYPPKPFAEWGCSSEVEALTVFDVGFWHSVYRDADGVVRHWLATGSEAQRWSFPEPGRDYTVYLLRGEPLEAFRELCYRGWRSTGAVELFSQPSAPLSVALPEGQIAGHRWSFLEMDPALRTARWATASEVEIRFDRPLPAGRYRLHLEGVRQPYPTAEVQIQWEVPGAAVPETLSLPSGPFHLTRAFTLKADLPSPRLRVRHPVWSPAEVGLSQDTRTLSFLFHRAWVEVEGAATVKP